MFGFSLFCYFALSTLIAFTLIMLLVAFFILGERKVLGYAQSRKGPNKVGLIGLLQSFADFIKLLGKSKIVLYELRGWLAWVGVVLMLYVAVGLCTLCAVYYNGLGDNNWLLWFLVVVSVSGHGLLAAGWGTYSKYALIGSLRVSFCSVMHEISFMCVCILMGVLLGGYWVYPLKEYVWGSWLVFLGVYSIWLISLLFETNRTPFDYVEAESELVSGLNVEYCGVPFLCLYACEYLIIYVSSWLTGVLFFGGTWFSLVFAFFHLFFFAWVRATLPRFRFDKLVHLMWSVGFVVLLLGVFWCLSLC
uniref:NADH-ubiquinone oxidoreductase chain 1 n=1 Tax=Postharmostomum commutatum TaxID=2336775 RepID=A0A5C1D644_9TREM|nr:NADH dehydrogenase subunit 1 [Postharmostomum commutatum]QEL51325.1 NADH dehydrogenase subunit 1 [Postharmostomum commutatum]